MEKYDFIITLNGHRYRVDMERADGYCIHPNKKGPPDLLFPNGKRASKKFLYELLHEALHACKWLKTEDDVIRIASDLSRLLWKAGYRLEGYNK